MAAGRIVTAALVVARLEGGSSVYLHRGDALPDEVTKDSVEHLTDLGFIEGGDVQGATDVDGDGPKTVEADEPKRSSTKK